MVRHWKQQNGVIESPNGWNHTRDELNVHVHVHNRKHLRSKAELPVVLGRQARWCQTWQEASSSPGAWTSLTKQWNHSYQGWACQLVLCSAGSESWHHMHGRPLPAPWCHWNPIRYAPSSCDPCCPLEGWGSLVGHFQSSRGGAHRGQFGPKGYRTAADAHIQDVLCMNDTPWLPRSSYQSMTWPLCWCRPPHPLTYPICSRVSKSFLRHCIHCTLYM